MGNKESSGWIELNLPYNKVIYDHFNTLKKVPRDILEKRYFNETGKSIADIENSIYTKQERADKEFFFNTKAYKTFVKYQGKIDDELKKDGFNLYDPERDAEFVKRMRALNNKSVNKLLDRRQLKKEYDDWYINQPEVIEYNKEYELLDKERKELESKTSFVGMGLNKPGTLIEVIIDGKLQVFLIGHINPLSGVCDDCPMFDNDIMVKRYKVIWEQKNEGN